VVAKSKAKIVQDARTGEQFLMYDIDIASWPGASSAPKVVYECGVCHGRFPPEEWKAGCPGCAKKAKDAEAADKAKPKRKWTLSEE
jgi:hypothetical protein